MADIDDELLALAGGDSEDEGDGGSRGDASPASLPSARRESARAAAKKAKRQSGGHDSDEGEPLSAPGTPNSLESAPMDESDSDAEQPTSRERAPAGGGDGDHKYPVDGMFVSQAEKAQIMAMREVEREQIIAERISEIERQRQNLLLRQMVTSVENEERKHVKKKRSADTAELEDGEQQRKASRQRTGKASESAMDSLRRARAEKQRRKEDQDRRKDGLSPRRDSLEPGSDDGFERQRPRSRTPPEKETKTVPAAELRDYDRVRLGRNEFAQVCSTPGFEAAITGCYMRLAVGPHPETGIEQYRMACIKGFTTGRPYALNGPNGVFVTDQYVKAAHGKAVKEFPFIAASSGKFLESELNRYQITCQNDGIALPTRQALVDRIDEINGLINHNWTGEEIKARLARRNELKRRFDPAERERVGRLLDEAAARGEDQRVEELQEELEKLSSQRLAFRTTLGSARGGEAPRSSEQDRLAERNRENRRMNAEQVRKAQLKEKAKAREIERAIKRGEPVADDPSRRLRTKAKFVHDVNEASAQNGGAASAASAASTPPPGTTTTTTTGTGTPKTGATKPPQLAPHLARLQERKKLEDGKGLPTIHKPLMDDDVIGALELDIDVEI